MDPIMNELLTNLLKLQTLEFDPATQPNCESQKAEIRTLIPPPILGHYDRLVSRGKKGVALVRNQVCTGCHMRLPIGTINTLMQGQDLQLCDSCGRYLCLPDPAAAQPAEVPVLPPAKPARKPRKSKALAPAA